MSKHYILISKFLPMRNDHKLSVEFLPTQKPHKQLILIHRMMFWYPYASLTTSTSCQTEVYTNIIPYRKNTLVLGSRLT